MCPRGVRVTTDTAGKINWWLVTAITGIFITFHLWVAKNTYAMREYRVQHEEQAATRDRAIDSLIVQMDAIDKKLDAMHDDIVRVKTLLEAKK